MTASSALRMRITVELFPAKQSKVLEIPDRATGLDLARALGLAPDAHILVRGESPIPIDAPLHDRERIRVISVVSGGSR